MGWKDTLAAGLASIVVGSSGCAVQQSVRVENPKPRIVKTVPKEFGRTQRLLDGFKKEGLRLEKRVRKGELDLNFYTVAKARSIMHTQKFHVKKKKFDRAEYFKFIQKSFGDAVKYYSTFMPMPLKRHHVIIYDFGKKRKGFSASVKANSTIIRVDVRRWHKYWSKGRKVKATALAAHEFTHVQNYSVDGDEKSHGKEYAAIMVECLTFINYSSSKNFKRRYRGRLIVFNPRPLKVKKNLHSNNVRRSIVRNLFLGAYDGTYAYPKGVTAKKALEGLSARVLKEQLNGEQGFDKSLKDAGFKYKGKHLTLKTLRENTYLELKELYKAKGWK